MPSARDTHRLVRRPDVRALTAGVVIAALCLAGIAAARSGPPDARSAAKPRRALVITGAVTGLYPGARKTLWLTFANRTRKRLQVRAVRIKTGAAHRTCPARHLVLGRTPRRFSIRPRRRVRRAMAVHMRTDAPDACKGARFRLTVRANTR